MPQVVKTKRGREGLTRYFIPNWRPFLSLPPAIYPFCLLTLRCSRNDTQEQQSLYHTPSNPKHQPCPSISLLWQWPLSCLSLHERYQALQSPCRASSCSHLKYCLFREAFPDTSRQCPRWYGPVSMCMSVSLHRTAASGGQGPSAGSSAGVSQACKACSLT